MRWLKRLLLAFVAGAIGAAAGRVAGDLRRQRAAGEALHLEVDSLRLGPRDIVPGLVAAMRMGEPPWSYLRIPPWFAALSVNFAFGALTRELSPLVSRFGGWTDAPPAANAPAPPPAPTSGWTAGSYEPEGADASDSVEGPSNEASSPGEPALGG